MKYAWIEDNRIRDLTPSDPFSWHHPDIAKFYNTQVPDEAENGDFWENGQLKKPENLPPAPFVPPPKEWNQSDFRNNMTISEKVSWDNDSYPEVITVKLELPKEKDDAQQLVDLLLSKSIISQATANKIMQ